MKKIIISILAVLLCVSIAACDKTSNNNSEDGSDSNSPITNEIPATETENPAQGTETENSNSKREVKMTVYETKVKTPLIKMASGDNSSVLDQCKKVGNPNDYDFYTVAVLATVGLENDYDFKGNEALLGIEDGLFYIAKHFSYLNDSQKSQLADTQNKQLFKTLYMIEYAVKKDTTPDIKLVAYENQEIMNLSNISFDGNIVESGDAYLWDTMKVSDEYGTEHYLIALPPIMSYDNMGHIIDSTHYFSFDLAQIGDCSNVPTDLKEIEKYYWNMEATTGLDITFAQYKYSKVGSPDSDKTIRFGDNFSNITKLGRANRFFDFNLEILSSSADESSFTPENSITIKLNDINLIFNNIEW